MTDQTGFPDRAQQLEILNRLKQAYPDPIDVQHWQDQYQRANLKYLHEHGLATVEYSGQLGSHRRPWRACLTAKGVDFIENDGGLSAILGVVTIKLHDDTIKTLIESKIMQSDLPQPDKRRYLDALRELPAESTKHLAMKLIDAGLANAPAAWIAIQNALSAAL